MDIIKAGGEQFVHCREFVHSPIIGGFTVYVNLRLFALCMKKIQLCACEREKERGSTVFLGKEHLLRNVRRNLIICLAIFAPKTFSFLKTLFTVCSSSVFNTTSL